MDFYTYMYLREDGTPYYVGKGSKYRAFDRQRREFRPPTDRARIRVYPMPDEATAFAYEIYLIDFWGRKDNETGILRNRTDGGDGVPREVLLGNKHAAGVVRSEETRRKMGLSKLGNKYGLNGKGKHPWTSEMKQAQSERARIQGIKRGGLQKSDGKIVRGKPPKGLVPWNKGAGSTDFPFGWNVA